MGLNFKTESAEHQVVRVLITRQAGNSFYASPRPVGKHKGQDVLAMVGSMEPVYKTDAQGKAIYTELEPLKLRLISGEDVLLTDRTALPCTFTMPENLWEKLCDAPQNAYIIEGPAMVNMNTNPDQEQLYGNLWVAFNHDAQLNVVPAPQRTAAVSKESLEAAINAARGRNEEGRLQASTRNAAVRLERQEQNLASRQELAKDAEGKTIGRQRGVQGQMSYEDAQAARGVAPQQLVGATSGSTQQSIGAGDVGQAGAELTNQQ